MWDVAVTKDDHKPFAVLDVGSARSPLRCWGYADRKHRDWTAAEYTEWSPRSAVAHFVPLVARGGECLPRGVTL